MRDTKKISHFLIRCILFILIKKHPIKNQISYSFLLNRESHLLNREYRARSARLAMRMYSLKSK